MTIKAQLHCKNTPDEMREMLIRATGATNDAQAEQRGEILTLLHSLDIKIRALRSTDSDDKFLDNIDRKLLGMLDNGGETPTTRSTYYGPRRGRF